MSKRERGDVEEELEAGKREKVQAEPSIVSLSEEVPVFHADGEDGEREEAAGHEWELVPREEIPHLRAEEGNDDLSEPVTDAASDEDAHDENSSEIDHVNSGDIDEDFVEDFCQFQEEYECPYSSHSHPYLFSFFRGPLQAPTSQTFASTRSVRIADLCPGYCGKWETTGRVVYKTPVLSYDNRNGRGSYFRFEIADEDGGEIRVVCFNDVVDRFFDKLVEGRRYVLANGRLKAPNELYNHEQRKCEIVLQHSSTIRGIPDEANPGGGTNDGGDSRTLTATNSGSVHGPSQTLPSGDLQKEDLMKRVAELEKNLELAHRSLAVANRSLEAANKNLEVTNKSLDLTCSQVQDYKVKIAQLKAMVT
ncbi:hypothetical protein KC19_1G060300 [Ceratodon purpureus]|uniref:OB domain-containing protein n=1 Tax=Ceratodon purpureus TaxID=3225 RepID=A0A8T0J4I6_CERPU|nr:hypothetical protein KC19_1G060300 [Ceratodon purpureus]